MQARTMIEHREVWHGEELVWYTESIAPLPPSCQDNPYTDGGNAAAASTAAPVPPVPSVPALPLVFPTHIGNVDLLTSPGLARLRSIASPERCLMVLYGLDAPRHDHAMPSVA